MEDNYLPGLPGSSSYNNSLGLTDWQAVIFKHDRMYKHKIMCINYTSYDIRQDDDVIYTGTRGQCNNVMVLALAHIRLYGHPFWYARVLGIYHISVIYTSEGNANFASPARISLGAMVRTGRSARDQSTSSYIIPAIV